MPSQLEQERKWLVKSPTSWLDIAQIFENLIDIRRINQTYLKPKPGEQAARIRKSLTGLTGDTKTEFHYNQKTPVETGVHQEKEHHISEKAYNQYLKHSNPDKCAIEKTRFVFKWHDQVFELDLFKGHLRGLAILEIELKDIDDRVELPDFLNIIKEITGDKQFNNFSLADKSLKTR